MVKPFGFSNQSNGEPLAELSSQEPLAGRKNLTPIPVIEETQLAERIDEPEPSSLEKNEFATPRRGDSLMSNPTSGQPKSKQNDSRYESNNEFSKSVFELKSTVVNHSDHYGKPIFEYRWKHASDGARTGKLEIEETDDIVLQPDSPGHHKHFHRSNS
jgi:hypothetical protein